MKRLSNDLTALVCSFLSQSEHVMAAKTCRQMALAVRSPLAWHHINISSEHLPHVHHLHPPVLDLRLSAKSKSPLDSLALASLTSQVQTLTLSRCDSFNMASIVRLPADKLQTCHLDGLTNHFLTKNVLEWLMHLPRLQRVTLRIHSAFDNPLGPVPIDSDLFRKLPVASASLTYSRGNAYGTTHHGLLQHLLACSKLRELTLDCEHVGSDSYTFNATLQFLMKSTTIDTLTLRDCGNCFNDDSAYYLTRLPLTSLDLDLASNDPCITCTALQQMSLDDSRWQLQRLRMVFGNESDTPFTDKDDVRAFWKKQTHLTDLELIECNFEMMLQLEGLSRPGLLKRLSFGHDNYAGIRKPADYAQLYPPLERMTGLETLVWETPQNSARHMARLLATVFWLPQLRRIKFLYCLDYRQKDNVLVRQVEELRKRGCVVQAPRINYDGYVSDSSSVLKKD